VISLFSLRFPVFYFTRKGHHEPTSTDITREVGFTTEVELIDGEEGENKPNLGEEALWWSQFVAYGTRLHEEEFGWETQTTAP
jgi:hypothetical protein